MMETPAPQVFDPPDINQVTLRFLESDPKASDVLFQNSLATPNGVTTSLGMRSCNVGKNVGSKSPEEFQKGVPGDIKVPGGMIAAFLEDQNKNRLKSTTSSFPIANTHSTNTSLANGNAIVSSTVNPNSNSFAISSSCTASKTEISKGKSKSGGSPAKETSSSKGDHVEIDVDMTLPQSEETRTTTSPYDADALVKTSGTNEIIRNGQKTSSNSDNCEVIMNNVSNPCSSRCNNTAQSSQHHHPHPKSQHEQEMQQHHQPVSPTHFPPSCEKDLEILKNVRKVYVQLTDDNTPCYYKVSDESEECLFETALGDTNGSIWSRYFKQQQKVILVHDRNQRGVLKLEFGRSRTISCCQTLRFAAMTASFKLKPEEPLCIIFKDKECCVSCCCCPEATYETVPQLDCILPFSVFTKGRWKNRAELMVKHNDGSILGFIDKEQNSYSLTMGENLKPAMKACLIGFLIAMDVMDRQDSAGKFSCYLRPTTILLIILLMMLCITIGGYLLHHFSSMFLYVKEDSLLCGSFDEAGSRRTATVPHFNNDRTSDSTLTFSGGTPPLSPSASFNSSSSSLTTSEFQYSSADFPSSGGGDMSNGAGATGGNNSSSIWPL